MSNEENKQNGNKAWIYITIAAVVIILVMLSMSMVSITVLDTHPLQNITLQINIT